MEAKAEADFWYKQYKLAKEQYNWVWRMYKEQSDRATKYHRELIDKIGRGNGPTTPKIHGKVGNVVHVSFPQVMKMGYTE